MMRRRRLRFVFGAVALLCLFAVAADHFVSERARASFSRTDHSAVRGVERGIAMSRTAHRGWRILAGLDSSGEEAPAAKIDLVEARRAFVAETEEFARLYAEAVECALASRAPGPNPDEVTVAEPATNELEALGEAWERFAERGFEVITVWRGDPTVASAYIAAAESTFALEFLPLLDHYHAELTAALRFRADEARAALDLAVLWRWTLAGLIGIVLFGVALFLERRIAAADERILEAEREIEALRRNDSELRVAKDNAERVSRAKSDFLANMSHEIRTPLNGILGMLDLLLHTSLTNEQQECAQTARSSADALHAILSDILDLSKIEARKVVLDHEPFDLVAVLEGAKNVVAAQARIRELDLRLELDPELPRYRVGDSTRLRQVVLNLLGNAIKFTHVGGVCLRLAPGRDTSNPTGVAIEVEDTGIGITPVQQKRLFQAFSQAEGSTSREYGGTGLGLFISREFVALMGGTMSVHSEPGEGSTFRVELDLPMARAEEVPPDRTQGFPASETAGTSRTDAKALPQLRLLVVDDNRINLRVTERILSRMGYQCAVCASGSEAIAHVAAKPVDVVFMDCQMPEIDGYEATRRVRARTDEIVQPWIVALTANALEGDRERCLAAGMDDYISKPVKRERLEAVMARAAEGVRKRKFGE